MTWKAALGAHPVITGAQKATGWTVQDSAKNIWKATSAPGSTPGSSPSTASWRPGPAPTVSRSDLTATTTGYTFTNSSLSYLNSLAQPGRTEIHGRRILHGPLCPRCPASATTPSPWTSPPGTTTPSAMTPCRAPSGHGPLYIENAYEFLDTAGEWYLDTRYRHPVLQAARRAGHARTPTSRCRSCSRSSASEARTPPPPRHIAFSGLQFSGTSWLDPSHPRLRQPADRRLPPGTWDRPSDALTSCQSGCPLFEATRPHWKPDAVRRPGLGRRPHRLHR